MTQIFPTKAYRRLLLDEIERRKPEHGTWPASWGDYNDPRNRERICRNILAARGISEYPTRGMRDDLRELVALRLAPWLRPQETRR